MNTNQIRTSASSKLIASVLLAACTLVLPVLTQARPAHFEGTFVLMYDVQWGKTVLPAGTYSLRVDQVNAVVENVDVYNTSTGKMVLGRTAAINYNSTANDSQILITIRGDRRAVYSVQLAGMGEVLRETRPFGTSDSAAEEAHNVQPIPIESARK
jgi:hypothetical protein